MLSEGRRLLIGTEDLERLLGALHVE